MITGRKDRQLDIERMARNRVLLPCAPVRTHDGKTIAAIMPTGEVNIESKGTEIKFRPVWVKTFLVCAIRKDTLTRLACEFEFGKYLIDIEGAHKADLTMSGDGTDPSTIEDSELVLGRLLMAPERPPVLQQAIEFIRRSF